MSKQAEQIAQAILATPTETRHELFREVAALLRANTNYFTASCLECAAKKYESY